MPLPATMPHSAAIDALIAIGRFFHQRGWVPATGGNFSQRLDERRMLITASGWHKGELDASAFLVTDLDGRVEGGEGAPSYETGLHAALYRRYPQVGCVLHTHSVANTVLSMEHAPVALQGYELLKILPAVISHEVTVSLPVFDNDQDIARLAERIDAQLQRRPQCAAYLLRGHGLYAWGDTAAQARHRVEALEFMLECELRRRGIRG